MLKKSTDQFIIEAKAIHGNKYLYPATQFTGSHKKVKVLCPEHGEFERTAREILKGKGCPQCSNRKPVTTERFIAAGRQAYGDAYDYTDSVCTSSKDKVWVRCRVEGHGAWQTQANNHMNGKAGCPKCAGNQLIGKEAFIQKALKVHSNLYSYPDTILYKNNHTHIDILCPTHGIFKQTPIAHLQGQGCPACAGKGQITTESFIAASKEIHGDVFDYSKAKFTSTAEKITLICKKDGYEFEQWYGAHIYQKSGCPKCAGNQSKSTEQFIAEARAVHGDTYDYSLTKYIGKAHKVSIVCPKHGEFTQTPNSHLSGRGCVECRNDAAKVLNADFIARASKVHSGRYTYENTSYVSMKDKVTVTCPKHGDYTVLAGHHLYRGVGCSGCSGTRQLTNDSFVEKARQKHGDTYNYDKVEYRGYTTPVTIICPTHGEFQQTPDSHLQGKGCIRCAGVGPSKAQREIMVFLSRYTQTVEEHKFPGSLRRFDIFLPEKKIAVEYNGLYWHSSRTEAIGREAEKHQIALENGVRVITVFEDEWYFQPNIVQRTLLSAIGALPKIYARKCEVRPVDQENACTFYMENHIQGNPRSPVHYGLYHNEELVACMSFGMLRSSRRNMDKRHWELTRYAATCTVVGGASRLLNAFRSSKLADKLTSYSDSRMFSGAMYEKLGFIRTHQTPPDYYYVNTSVAGWRIHKAKFQKKHLKRIFPECDLSKTEKQICEENGYYQVYDCGKVRWDLVF